MHLDYTDICETYRIYKLHQLENGSDYICGNLNITPRAYNPMEHMTDIIMRLIDIGKAYERGETIKYVVQDFCVQYGQLGFIKAEIEKTYDDKSVKFYAGNVFERKAATEQELKELAHPFLEDERRQSRRVVPKRVSELAISESIALQDYATDYNTCEAVAWYGEYGKRIYELLRRKQAGDSFVLTPGNAELRYEVSNGIARRHWYFDSLKSACDVWLMEKLTDERPPIRLCKRCGKAFVAGSAKTEYCSTSCRNVENVANSRKRKREASASSDVECQE